MYNKIKSIAATGKRKPGRPFNTTTYPWRSTAIGRGFFLRPGMKPGQQTIQCLRTEGFRYRAVDLSDASTIRFYMVRVA